MATPYQPISYLDDNAGRFGDRPAVVDPERTLTFSELRERVRAAACALSDLPVTEGDVVGVRLPNVWEYVVLELAIPMLGAVLLPLPLTLGTSELDWAVQRSQPRLLVTAADDEAHAVASRLGVALAPVAQFAEASAGAKPPAPAAPDPKRIVEIALTSGTTGMPKLASLSAGLKQATFEGFTGRLGITAADRVLPMSPLTQGIGGMTLFCLRLGASIVMLREPRFSAEQTLAVAERTGTTALIGVPTNVIRMLDSPRLAETHLDSLRVTAVAGSLMPPAVAQRWEESTRAKVCIFYGSMDAGQLSVGSPDDPAEKRWTTVGRAHDCCECQICDADGRPLPAGEAGEICMRGPTVQERYWGESSGPYAADGWAHMGDLGRVDEDGYLQVVGRVKDIIIRGGSNINPYEVEDHIRAHPHVRDVAVVGRPDRELGERAMAFVVGDLSLEELRTHLAARGVAKYKWPESLSLLPELPLSGPGKPNRRALKEMASAGSAL